MPYMVLNYKHSQLTGTAMGNYMKNVLNDSFDQPNCESGVVLTIAVAVNKEHKEHRTRTTFTLSSSTTSLRKEVGASIVLLLHSISNDIFQKFGKAIFYSQVF